MAPGVAKREPALEVNDHGLAPGQLDDEVGATRPDHALLESDEWPLEVERCGAGQELRESGQAVPHREPGGAEPPGHGGVLR